jgi:hypothetical protein
MLEIDCNGYLAEFRVEYYPCNRETGRQSHAGYLAAIRNSRCARSAYKNAGPGERLAKH